MERIVVASRSDSGGERFCILRPDRMSLFPIGSVVELPARVEASLRGVEWLPEDKIRRDLAASGLSIEDVERQFARARSMRSWLGDLVMERITTPG
jgi:hypothetical protein